MKQLNLPNESVKTLLQNASMFLIPIEDNGYEMALAESDEDLISFSPYQIGDEVYLQEDIKYQSLDKVYTENTKLNRQIASNLGYKIGTCTSNLIGFCIKPLSLIGLEGVDYLCSDLHLFNAPYNHNSMYKRINLAKYKSTIKDVKVIRVQDIDLDDWFTLGVTCPAETECMRWYNLQYKNYEDNPYIFLYTIKEIK